MIRSAPLVLLLAATLAVTGAAQTNPNPVPKDPSEWKQHSLTRPKPPVITPGAMGSTGAPSDAIVLFDGTSLDAWRVADTALKPARWTIVDGAMEVAPGTGSIQTRRSFGDVQLHIEWMTPTPPKGESQERGNSGVFLMNRYEVQVLDSYNNPTYADGQAGSIYGQFPPKVNATRPPGEWQSYDIVFHRPHFDTDGRLTVPARLTVFHNGVLVQEDQMLLGPTSNSVRSAYLAHPDALPLQLQDHGVKVRFRNIWIRELGDG
ncbi:MAG: DUF1080 domain-containing protein [Gemmatimonadota bacterium]